MKEFLGDPELNFNNSQLPPQANKQKSMPSPQAKKQQPKTQTMQTSEKEEIRSADKYRTTTPPKRGIRLAVLTCRKGVSCWQVNQK